MPVTNRHKLALPSPGGLSPHGELYHCIVSIRDQKPDREANFDFRPKNVNLSSMQLFNLNNLTRSSKPCTKKRANQKLPFLVRSPIDRLKAQSICRKKNGATL